MLIYSHFEHGLLLNISCRNFFDICKINRMVPSLMKLGYVNNYDKNLYLEKLPKAAVCTYAFLFLILIIVHNAVSRKPP